MIQVFEVQLTSSCLRLRVKISPPIFMTHPPIKGESPVTWLQSSGGRGIASRSPAFRAASSGGRALILARISVAVPATCTAASMTPRAAQDLAISSCSARGKCWIDWRCCTKAMYVSLRMKRGEKDKGFGEAQTGRRDPARKLVLVLQLWSHRGRWIVKLWEGIICESTPWKYAPLPCGHLDFKPAVTAQNDEFKDSFDSSYSRLLNVKIQPRNSLLCLDTFRYVR